MATWNHSNHKPSFMQNKPVSVEEARNFWSSENGIAAQQELVELLLENPKPTNDPDLIAWASKYALPLYGKQINIVYIKANNNVFKVKPAGRFFLCGLADKDDNDAYWPDVPSLKVFWGVVAEREEKDRFGGINKVRYISDAQIENEGSRGEVEIPPNLNNPPSVGVFTVGRMNDSAKWLRPFDAAKTPFMVRVWADFKESENFPSLEEYMKSNP